jgi:hypothetical protein
LVLPFEGAVFRNQNEAQSRNAIKALCKLLIHWCPEGDLVFEAYCNSSKLLIRRRARWAKTGKTAPLRPTLGTHGS